jgi:hypothetical protein
MSETAIVPGQWFYETVGKTWFIVRFAHELVIQLREPDTGTKNYVKWCRRSNLWQPAKQNDRGDFYIVKAKYGNFEFRGDEGPADAQLEFCSYFRTLQAEQDEELRRYAYEEYK